MVQRERVEAIVLREFAAGLAELSDEELTDLLDDVVRSRGTVSASELWIRTRRDRDTGPNIAPEGVSLGPGLSQRASEWPGRGLRREVPRPNSTEPSSTTALSTKELGRPEDASPEGRLGLPGVSSFGQSSASQNQQQQQQPQALSQSYESASPSSISADGETANDSAPAKALPWALLGPRQAQSSAASSPSPAAGAPQPEADTAAGAALPSPSSWSSLALPVPAPSPADSSGGPTTSAPDFAAPASPLAAPAPSTVAPQGSSREQARGLVQEPEDEDEQDYTRQLLMQQLRISPGVTAGSVDSRSAADAPSGDGSSGGSGSVGPLAGAGGLPDWRTLLAELRIRLRSEQGGDGDLPPSVSLEPPGPLATWLQQAGLSLSAFQLQAPSLPVLRPPTLPSIGPVQVPLPQLLAGTQDMVRGLQDRWNQVQLPLSLPLPLSAGLAAATVAAAAGLGTVTVVRSARRRGAEEQSGGEGRGSQLSQPARRKSRVEEVGSRQGGRVEEVGSRQGGRVEEVGSRQGGRVEEVGSRQGGRVEEVGSRQGGRVEEVGSRQDGRVEEVGSRQGGDQSTGELGAIGASELDGSRPASASPGSGKEEGAVAADPGRGQLLEWARRVLLPVLALGPWGADDGSAGVDRKDNQLAGAPAGGRGARTPSTEAAASSLSTTASGTAALSEQQTVPSEVPALAEGSAPSGSGTGLGIGRLADPRLKWLMDNGPPLAPSPSLPPGGLELPRREPAVETAARSTETAAGPVLWRRRDPGEGGEREAEGSGARSSATASSGSGPVLWQRSSGPPVGPPPVTPWRRAPGVAGVRPAESPGLVGSSEEADPAGPSAASSVNAGLATGAPRPDTKPRASVNGAPRSLPADQELPPDPWRTARGAGPQSEQHSAADKAPTVVPTSGSNVPVQPAALAGQSGAGAATAAQQEASPSPWDLPR